MTGENRRTREKALRAKPRAIKRMPLKNVTISRPSFCEETIAAFQLRLENVLQVVGIDIA